LLALPAFSLDELYLSSPLPTPKQSSLSLAHSRIASTKTKFNAIKLSQGKTKQKKDYH